MNTPKGMISSTPKGVASPKKKIVISSGDPGGCGPFITLKAIENLGQSNLEFFVVGDQKLFQKLPIYKKVKNRINLIDLNTPGIERIKAGQSSRLSGKASLSYLNKALELIDQKKINRLVTAPSSKEAVKLVLKKFCGHTEYLADYFKADNFAMMMVSAELKVVMATRHINLKAVSSSLKGKDIYNLLSLTYRFLQNQFKIKCPRIVFCAVNPHAGVNTFIGNEEKKILQARKKFKKLTLGPYPADTIFTKEKLKHYDCVICAYHDQAMIPFKLLSFHTGVNVTLGLPIVRTSPAHGVAYDIVAKGKQPFHSSMLEAIKLASKLSR